MPASLAEVVIQDRPMALHCPVTGRKTIDPQTGWDPEEPQSPYLRFFVDGMRETFVMDPDQLPAEHSSAMARVREILAHHDRFESQNEQIEACRLELPESAVIFELLDPPQGSFGGYICYACFDFAEAAEGGEKVLDRLKPADLD